jgi:signal transduction histidine kinase
MLAIKTRKTSMDFPQILANLTADFDRWCTMRSRGQMVLLTFVLVFVVGIADYASGTDITLSVIYAVPILMAAWYVNAAYGASLAVLSVVIWMISDATLGIRYSNMVVPAWNATIRLVFYIFVIMLLTRINSLHRLLERRVDERAMALTREIGERERLERDLLEVSEREQRRIGQDLHDGLCQHLTGTAIASHVLAESLSAQGLRESSDARRIVDHIEDAITLARGMAKGLHPVEMEADGLMQALYEFSAATSEMLRVSCRFECDSPVLVHDTATATNLYRIAQESVSNALKHGRASEIVIALENSEQGIVLRISGNGSGMPVLRPSGGMGLRIMANRAKVIGASFDFAARSGGGTEIVCLAPDIGRPGISYV